MENQKENPTLDGAMGKAPQAPRKVYYPPYWAKRKGKLKKEFIKKLQDSANSEVIASDEYGEYRAGTFLYKAAIVTVQRDNGLWSLHVMSEQFISFLLVEEIRYMFLPDGLLMAQLYGSRKEAKSLKGIVLYEIPRETKEEAK